MTLSEETKALEARLSESKISLDAVLSDANVDRSTWTRWKNGSVVGARYDTFSRVRESAERALAGHAASAA